MGLKVEPSKNQVVPLEEESRFQRNSSKKQYTNNFHKKKTFDGVLWGERPNTMQFLRVKPCIRIVAGGRKYNSPFFPTPFSYFSRIEAERFSFYCSSIWPI